MWADFCIVGKGHQMKKLTFISPTPIATTHLVLQKQLLGSIDDTLHEEGVVAQQGAAIGLGDQAEDHERLHHQLPVLWVRETVQLGLQGERKLELSSSHLRTANA